MLSNTAKAVEFQSAPRLVAAENLECQAQVTQITRFNPLRGLWPRRTFDFPIRIEAPVFQSAPRLVAAENACHYYLFQCQRMFQSAPRLVAAENTIFIICGRRSFSFNPLRGLWPRRTIVVR